MTIHVILYQVLSRGFKPLSFTDAAKAGVAAAMRAMASGRESVIAVHRSDKLVQLYRVQPDGTISRGTRIDVTA